MKYCHGQNIIHRDLKLENVILAKKDSYLVKLVDFGIAGITTVATDKINVGSLRYMVNLLKLLLGSRMF